MNQAYHNSTCNLEADTGYPNIEFHPDGTRQPVKKQEVTIRLKDDFVFAANQKISYVWVKAGTETPVSSVKTKILGMLRLDVLQLWK